MPAGTGPTAGAGGGGSTSNAVRAGGAFVELFTQDNRLIRGLTRAGKLVGDWGKSVRNAGVAVLGLGMATLAPIAALTKGAFEKSITGMFGQKAAGDAIRALAAWERMTFALQKATLPIIERLVPLLEMLADVAEKNSHLVPIVAAVGLALVGGGAAMMIFGQAMSFLSTSISVGLNLLSIFGTALTFLKTPMGAAIALVALLTAGFIIMFEYFNQGPSRIATEVGAKFSEAFAGFYNDFKTAFGGVIAAFRSGQLELAADIAIKGLHIAWKRFQIFMNSIWDSIKSGFREVIAVLLYDIQTLAAELAYAVGDGMFSWLYDDAENARIFKNHLKVLDSIEKRRNAFTAPSDASKDKAEQLRKELAALQEELNKMAGDAIKAVVAPGMPGYQVVREIAATRGAFSAPNWNQVMGAADKIPQQTLDTVRKQLQVQNKILDKIEEQPKGIKP